MATAESLFTENQRLEFTQIPKNISKYKMDTFVIMRLIFTYVLFIAQYIINLKHISLKQMKFNDSNISEYQKFKVDKLPIVVKFEKVIATVH